MTTTSRKSRILQGVHETAQGLHGAGLISKRRMGEFDALCHLDVAAMSPQKIRRLRQNEEIDRRVASPLRRATG